MLAILIGILGDFDLAEDALQDAVVAATSSWPDHGIPDNPAGWLVTTARRKAIDRLRSTAASDRRQRAWGELSIAWDAGDGSEPIADERLRLIFTCCHPALTLEAQVALTLRSLGGLSTEEVAKAFLISEAALSQRIVRAKRKIRQAGIAYRVPSKDEFADRLAAVLAVVYLIFNEGYSPPPTRTDLAARMGVSPGRVSQILGGGENLTLRTLAALSTALDARFDIGLSVLKADDTYISRSSASAEAPSQERG